MDSPAAPPAPKAPSRPIAPNASIPESVPLDTSSGETNGAEAIVIFGTGGIGKSYLAAFLPAPLFIDVEKGTGHLSVTRDDKIGDWMTLRGKLSGIANNPPEGIKTIVIDTATVAEEFAKNHVVATRTTEKGHHVNSIEGFGWGKGWQFVYEEWQGLLSDVDRVRAKGINACFIAHDVTSPVPNPEGEDFIRYEPHLYSGDKKGRGSIRERVKQWADHVLFVGYDRHVEDGKAQGAGTRTVYTYELPTFIAKSRSKAVSLSFTLEDPGAVWRELGITA